MCSDSQHLFAELQLLHKNRTAIQIQDTIGNNSDDVRELHNKSSIVKYV